MVRKLFYVLIAIVALCSPALAGGRDCDDCDIFRHGVHRQVIPTNDLTCFYYVQPHEGTVYLKLYLRDGHIRPYTKVGAPTRGHICVGREWARRMTKESFICNDENYFVYGVPGMIEVLAQKPAHQRAPEACLYGEDACRKMGYYAGKQ